MTFQVTLDLLKPCLEEQKMERAVLQEMLWRRAGQLPSEPVGMLLRGILNEKLIPLMLNQAGIRSKLQCRELTEKELCTYAEVMRWPLMVQSPLISARYVREG